ncbi:MAG: 4Fe-4S binding protein [Bacillota bacterium]
METYRIECCRSREGCRRAVVKPNDLIGQIQDLLIKADFEKRRNEQFPNGFKQHNIFKITLAGCANSCSQPQIKDFALIAKVLPQFNKQLCNFCGLCVKTCKENCLKITDQRLHFMQEGCLGCGDCIRACPSNAIFAKEPVWRLLLGGKLGRHPQLAMEIKDVNQEEALKSLNQVIELLLNAENPHERFGEIIKKGLNNF